MNAAARNEVQRRALLVRLHANRLALMESCRGRPAAGNAPFPRSLTMRLLMGTSGTAGFLSRELVLYLLGRYLARRSMHQAGERRNDC